MKGGVYMNSEEIMLQMYKIYSEQKEKFVDRSFCTNKFYLLLIIGLVIAMHYTKDLSFVFGITTTLLLSAAGIAICVLWWINVDSYNFLIKVKLSSVLQEIEKNLPVKPYTEEFAAITELRKRKREFLFADIQKALATLALLIFLVLFINEVLIMITT